MKPLVTIAIPTYNRAHLYLRDCIQSALEQTYDNLEILISDNYSTDNTTEIVETFNDPRIRYFRQSENIGQNRNMNFLIEAARGVYFLMYHDDDRIDDDFIETCMRAADYRSGIGLILTGSRVIDKEGNIIAEKENNAAGLPVDDFILLWYQKKIHLFFCCSLFGTKALRETGGFNRKYHHFDDVAAEFSCAARSGRIDVKELKSSFRVHPASGTSASNLSDWCDSSLALLDLAFSLAPSREKELQSIGLRTSAERNYRFASEASTKYEMWKAYWIVYKKFKFKQFPPRRYLYTLVPPLKYLLQPSKLVARMSGRAG
jgi:glycosyltransferase involved in cell wall biosynthesis